MISIGRLPVTRLKAHNAITLLRVVAVLQDGPQPRSVAVLAAQAHESGDASKPTPEDFINYCIRCGWLEED